MTKQLSPLKLKAPPAQAALKAKLAVYPNAPGVYKMFDEAGQLLYIGKAKKLRSRIRSYFSYSNRALTRILVSQIARIDYIVTATEKEALLLENQLIKKHKPFFNIDLKDNKTYPYLWLTTHEKFPRLLKTRVLSKKGLWFGPYTNLKQLDATLAALHALYPLKKCSQRRFPIGFRPCLYFHLNKCLDYCTGQVSQTRIAQLVSEIKTLLSGKNQAVLTKLREQLSRESQARNYEKALVLKNFIDALSQQENKDNAVTLGQENFDVLNYITQENFLIISLLQFREGKLLEKQTFEFENALFSEEIETTHLAEESFLQFVFNHYQNQVEETEALQEIVLPPLLHFSKAQAEEENAKHWLTWLEESLAEKKAASKKSAIKLTLALKGKKHRLLALAAANAQFSLQELLRKREKQAYGKALRDLLRLKRIPLTIEAFDVANTGEKYPLAGMVYFKAGVRDKSQYRSFNFPELKAPNDFAAIEKAVYRRYRRLLEEKRELPELILIDGGKGQLSAAKHSLNQLGLSRQPIIALAKKEELIYVPKKMEPLRVPHTNPALRFLVAVRDEVHRFTNLRHVRKRDAEELKSQFKALPGFGEKKIQILLERFSSWQEMKQADEKTLLALPFFGAREVQRLKAYFSLKR